MGAPRLVIGPCRKDAAVICGQDTKLQGCHGKGQAERKEEAPCTGGEGAATGWVRLDAHDPAERDLGTVGAE